MFFFFSSCLFSLCFFFLALSLLMSVRAIQDGFSVIGAVLYKPIFLGYILHLTFAKNSKIGIVELSPEMNEWLYVASSLLVCYAPVVERRFGS